LPLRRQIGPYGPGLCLGSRPQLLSELGRLAGALPDPFGLRSGLGYEFVRDAAGLFANVVGLAPGVEQCRVSNGRRSRYNPTGPAQKCERNDPEKDGDQESNDQCCCPDIHRRLPLCRRPHADGSPHGVRTAGRGDTG
jgi:hypothetical protein